jgi:hypothetical protein
MISLGCCPFRKINADYSDMPRGGSWTTEQAVFSNGSITLHASGSFNADDGQNNLFWQFVTVKADPSLAGRQVQYVLLEIQPDRPGPKDTIKGSIVPVIDGAVVLGPDGSGSGAVPTGRHGPIGHVGTYYLSLMISEWAFPLPTS